MTAPEPHDHSASRRALRAARDEARGRAVDEGGRPEELGRAARRENIGDRRARREAVKAAVSHSAPAGESLPLRRTRPAVPASMVSESSASRGAAPPPVLRSMRRPVPLPVEALTSVVATPAVMPTPVVARRTATGVPTPEVPTPVVPRPTVAPTPVVPRPTPTTRRSARSAAATDGNDLARVPAAQTRRSARGAEPGLARQQLALPPESRPALPPQPASPPAPTAAPSLRSAPTVGSALIPPPARATGTRATVRANANANANANAPTATRATVSANATANATAPTDDPHPPWQPSTLLKPPGYRSSGASDQPIPSVRRAARATELMTDAGVPPIRHARARRARWIGAIFAGIAAGALVFGGAAAVTAAVAGPVVSDSAGLLLTGQPQPVASPSPTASLVTPPAALPVPTATPAPAVVDVCADPDLTTALAAGDDVAAIAAAGGAEAFRDAVATGRASCVSLDDPTRTWVVVNKSRPFAPIDYDPASLAAPENVRSIEGGTLRTDAAAALTAMVAGAAAEGAGEIALESGFRSYTTQQTNYGNGGPDVDASVARPGYSEHQSGLAADVVPCNDGCSTMDDLAASPQGAWIVANAWRYGWIVRYEAGRTEVTGYMPEPWHLRFIGTDLAAAYHNGGWQSLEEFFGLSAAPDYAS